MGVFRKVAEIKDLEPGSAKRVEIEGKEIALFNIDGAFYAIQNTCTHRGGPLADGDLDGDVVTCPWHGARYDVKSGEVLGPPASQGVMAYKVRVQGEDIEIEVP